MLEETKIKLKFLFKRKCPFIKECNDVLPPLLYLEQCCSWRKFRDCTHYYYKIRDLIVKEKIVKQRKKDEKRNAEKKIKVSKFIKKIGIREEAPLAPSLFNDLEAKKKRKWIQRNNNE